MAGKENKMQNNTKKTLEKDDAILSDFEASPFNFRCGTCSINFSDVKNYESHMNGRKHQTAVENAKCSAKREEFNKKTEEENENDDDSEDSGEIKCEICNISVTGYIPYMTHLKGSKHAKNVKKKKLKAQTENMPEVLPKENVEDDEILQKPYARCDLCEKEFSGPESLTMHMKSSLHEKKIKESKALKIVKEKYQDESKSNNENDSFSNCSLCRKSFSGPVPYQIHMESKLHDRNVEKRKMAEEFEEFCCISENGTVYMCKECQKTFKDPAAFKYHKNNNSHDKLKAKTNLFECLNSYPEITTPSGDQNKENDSDIPDENYLSCKLCEVAFSGPESAHDHVKSQKHMNLLKTQKCKKNQKEKDKQANDSSKLNGEEVKPSQSVKVTEMPNVPNGDAVNGGTNKAENLRSADDFEFV